jgi:hypothetical protein
MLDILLHYQDTQGIYFSFALPADTLSGLTAADYTLTGFSWRYAVPPTVLDLPCDRYTVEVELESVESKAALISVGLRGRVGLSLLGGSAFAANGIDAEIGLALNAGSFGVAGITESIGLAFADNGAVGGNGSVGLTETISLELAAGSVAAANGIVASVTVSFVAGAAEITDAFDSDAAAYITAVETADTQSLETGVKLAINDFVVGCKDDGIWAAIKASCILAGARTLTGALVPLVGTAPTNNNFVSEDYNRKTGLVGDGSTKYLDTNSSPTAAPETLTSFAYAVYCSQLPTNGINSAFMGYRGNTSVALYQLHRNVSNLLSAFNKFGNNITRSQSSGFIGSARSGTTESLRSGGATTTATSTASENFSNQNNVGVFSFREVNGSRVNMSNARISFYLQAAFLDLALLDARVTTLIDDIDAAIP